MPYIKRELRKLLDAEIDALYAKLSNEQVGNDIDGCLNYVITKLIHRIYPRRYFSLNRAIGVLECAKQELYRRIVGPYEDEKIAENGDV